MTKTSLHTHTAVARGGLWYGRDTKLVLSYWRDGRSRGIRWCPTVV